MRLKPLAPAEPSSNQMSSALAMETAAEFAARFGRFVDNSPTPYHVVREVSARLVGCGFVRLLESQPWKDVRTSYRLR
jgi:aspartyl aminopeptidase